MVVLLSSTALAVTTLCLCCVRVRFFAVGGVLLETGSGDIFLLSCCCFKTIVCGLQMLVEMLQPFWKFAIVRRRKSEDTVIFLALLLIEE